MASIAQIKHKISKSFKKNPEPLSKKINSFECNTVAISKSTELNRSLKRMEFVNFFESSIAESHKNQYSLGFLKELEQMKKDLQIKTLDLIYSS